MIARRSEIRDGMRVDWNVPIQMDDGVVLRADVFRPERWVPHGYALVRIDSRGSGRSEGFLDPFSARQFGGKVTIHAGRARPSHPLLPIVPPSESPEVTS